MIKDEPEDYNEYQQIDSRDTMMRPETIRDTMPESSYYPVKRARRARGSRLGRPPSGFARLYNTKNYPKPDEESDGSDSSSSDSD